MAAVSMAAARCASVESGAENRMLLDVR